ncbi:hypothetical protein [Methanohalobium sp.]|uniref:hypothetical protein n=1 Tax=Methanohalobium sp. TaxID=2837493 RepID=UPI0025FB1848|nr:hypothetical protein [Methanohalobium sp.]
MLTSVVSTTSAISSATASAVSMTTGLGLPEFGVMAVIGLISLLAAKEILSASNYWSKKLSSSLNMGILPLMVSFSAIVVFKVMEII